VQASYIYIYIYTYVYVYVKRDMLAYRHMIDLHVMNDKMGSESASIMARVSHGLARLVIHREVRNLMDKWPLRQTCGLYLILYRNFVWFCIGGDMTTYFVVLF